MEDKRVVENELHIDWFDFKSTAPKESFVPEDIHIAGKNVSIEERKLMMLRQLSLVCSACSMCELGLKHAEKNDIFRDPHMFSNMSISKFMVVGQNPGWDELKCGEPFVGAAGNNFDKEIAKHGLFRNDFYICNTIRCWTKKNSRPEHRHLIKCEPFLQMEINLLKPKIIIALGSVAFSQLCPTERFRESLKKLIPSRYNIKVFPIYHPSPINFLNGCRRMAFEDQIKIMCHLVKAIKNDKTK